MSSSTKSMREVLISELKPGDIVAVAGLDSPMAMSLLPAMPRRVDYSKVEWRCVVGTTHRKLEIPLSLDNAKQLNAPVNWNTLETTTMDVYRVFLLGETKHASAFGDSKVMVLDTPP